MKKVFSILPRWLPALLVMAVIFYLSSQPSDNLPNLQSWDRVFKKAGHMTGYGLLALSYFYWMKYDAKYYWLAWLLAIIYAATDEFHQSFVVTRSASVFDVLVFDNFGAIVGLLLHFIYRRKYEKQIDPS